MPMIPRYRAENRLSKRIPTPDLSEKAGDVGDELSKLGVAGQAFFEKLAKQRKAANDSLEANDKYLQYNRDLLKLDSELKINMSADGTLNPDIYGTDEDGRNLKYGDVFQEQSKSLRQSVADTSSNIETKKLFDSKAETLRRTMTVAADAETYKRFVTTRVDWHRGETEKNKRTILTHPEIYTKNGKTTVDSVTRGLLRNVHDMHRDGVINSVTSQALLKETKNELGVGYAQNLLDHSKPATLLAFLKLGRLEEGYQGIDELEQDILYDTTGLDPRDIEVLKAKNLSKEDAKRLESEQMSLASLSRSLTPEQASIYYNKAKRLLGNVGAQEQEFYKQNLSNFFDMIYSGRGGEIENFNKQVDFLERQIAKREKGIQKPIQLMRLSVAKVVTPILNEAALLDPQQQEQQKAALLKGPKKALAEVFSKYPETRKFSNQLKQSFVTSNIAKNLNKVYDAAVASYNKERKRDGASFWLKHDSTIKKTLETGKISEYINFMDQRYNQFKTPDIERNYVPKEWVDNFIKTYDLTEDASKKTDMLLGLKSQWGSGWNRINIEYLSKEEIPFEARVALTFSDRASMKRMISVLNSKNLKAMKADFKTNEDNDIADIHKEMADSDLLQNFKRGIRFTSADSGQAARVNNTFNDAVIGLSMHSILQGEDVDDAVEGSIKEVLGANYHVLEGQGNVVFIPKTAKSNPTRVQQFIENIGPQNVSDRVGKIPIDLMSEVQALKSILGKNINEKQAFKEFIKRNGKWVTSRDMKGLTVNVFSPKNRQWVPISDKNNQPIIFSWEMISFDEDLRKALKPFMGGH